jgi:hypothetical protein
MGIKPILISELITASEAELSAKGYSIGGKSGIITTFRQFQEYANKRRIQYYTSELNEQFF